jgi:Exonuclease V - a 5' deoxyribonuclease
VRDAIPLHPRRRQEKNNSWYPDTVPRLRIAMRQGNKIHKELENELHETIEITQIMTAEETLALRFLNILFGLRELKSRGMTVPLISCKLMIERIPCLWIHRSTPCKRRHRSNNTRTRTRTSNRSKTNGCLRHSPS